MFIWDIQRISLLLKPRTIFISFHFMEHEKEERKKGKKNKQAEQQYRDHSLLLSCINTCRVPRSCLIPVRPPSVQTSSEEPCKCPFNETNMFDHYSCILRCNFIEKLIKNTYKMLMYTLLPLLNHTMQKGECIISAQTIHGNKKTGRFFSPFIYTFEHLL